VHYRDEMFTHNYPHLLQRAGFRITKAEIVRTDHPHPDYRLFCFVAEKR
jgi:hypothetical protein